VHWAVVAIRDKPYQHMKILKKNAWNSFTAKILGIICRNNPYIEGFSEYNFQINFHTFTVELFPVKKIVLLSDTHGYIDQKIKDYVAKADEVWHAGDIGSQQAPEVLSFNCEGIDVLMTHIAGYPGRYNARAKDLITTEKPGLFICGHSHILKVIRDKKYGHLHMNPGAIGISGFHKIRTLLRFEIDTGEIKNLEAVELGLRRALSNAVDGAN